MEVIMNKLIATAKKLDTFFKILDICLTIAVIACCVGAAISAAGLIFDVPSEYIGSDINVINIDFLEITLADEYAPDTNTVLCQWLIVTLLAAACAFIVKLAVKCVRDMLSAMSKGEPFNSAVNQNLKKIGVYSIILGVAENILILTEQSFFIFGYKLTDILTSEKIASVGIVYSLDLNFLVIAAILFLLSYIFKYGEELQNQADETL